ncbi:MAG TPA: cation transport ATPase [Saprospirales bacterium]|nr:cation transport ATPase [Saprospirales bacterium]HAY71500.1 cation transport ATPase [Saprospirales bacterium]HRQ30393.1 heavy metal-associated domain-containing protein [Saprospiraceae bacterium]
MAKLLKTLGLLFVVFVSVNLVSPVISLSQTAKKTETKKAGKSSIKSVELAVSGMTCQKGCADGIDKKLRKTAGIRESKTVQKTGTSKIIFDASVISVKEIIKIIEDRGYKAKIATS